MANPIKVTDVYQHGNELKKLITDLENADKALERLVKDAELRGKSLADALKALSPENGDQQKKIRETADSATKLQKAYKRYNAALEDNAVELAKVKAATREANTVAKLQAKLVTSVEGSYDNLSAQYSLNKIALNKLTAAERENNAEAKLLEEQTKDIFDEMKRLQAATGKTSLNVGNYTEAIQDAISGSLSFNGVLSLISKNPIIGVLTLIVGAVTALFKAFTRTAKGAEVLARVGGILEGVFSVIIGLVDRLASGLISAVTDPKQAIQDFGEFLKNQLVNRIKGVIDLIGGLASAIGNLLVGNFKKAGEEAKRSFGGAIQSITGLDEEMRNGLLKTIVETADAFGDLRVQQRKLEIQTARLGVAFQKASIEAQKLKEISDDDTRSFKERAEASEAAATAIIKASQIERNIARSRLALVDQEIKLRKANREDLQALTVQRIEAQGDLVAAEGELTLAILENNQRRAKLIQDREELELDILIDGLNNQLAINREIIESDRLTLGERLKLLKESREISDGSFEDQIKLIQQFTKANVDGNDLVRTSDARVLFDKIRGLELSEILETRLLEIVRDRRDVINDLGNAQRFLTEQLQQAALADDRFVNALVKGNDGLTERVKLFSEQSALGKAAAEENAKEIETFLTAFRKRIAPKEKPKSLLEILGITVGDEAKAGIKSAFDFAKAQLDSFLKKRTELTDKQVELSDREVENAQNNLDTQLALAAQGQTANIEDAKKELELAKDTQAKALEQQRKAQRAEQDIQTIQQTVNLATMATKVYSQLGFPLGLFAVGTMLAAFTAAKLRIRGLTKKIFRKGGSFQLTDAGTHESGNDAYLGNHGGQDMYAEKDEVVSVFSRQAVRKYGASKLMEMVDGINGGKAPLGELSAAYSITPTTNVNINTKGIEQRLDKANGRETVTTLPDGRVLIKKGLNTEIINYAN